jgi:hypothetical protein
MGYTFASYDYSIDTTPPYDMNVTSVKLQNGAFDELHITKDANHPYGNGIDAEWDYDTVLHAKFKGTTYAGNVDFIDENTTGIRVKRRMQDTFEWVSLYDIPTNPNNSYAFDYYDMTVRSGIEYEYAVLPISGTVEGEYIVQKITPEFCGLFIVERDQYVSTYIEPKISNQYVNSPAAVIATMGNKYPFVISNGISNYKSGTLSAVWMEFEENCNWNLKMSWKYRDKLNEFLTNKQAKLIKYEDGRMWLASISSPQITEQDGGHDYKVSTSFMWAEVGNCDKNADLFKFGFVDVRDGDGMVSAVSATAERFAQIEYEIQQLKGTKANDIVFNNTSGTLRLTANGEPIGNTIDLETPFGKEFIIKPVT